MENNFLVIEDDISQYKYFETILQENKYNCTIVDTISKALSILKKQNFFMAFLDLNLPDGHGFQVLEYINQNNIVIYVAVTSVTKNPEAIISSFKLGAVDYLIKPISEETLLEAINNAKKRREGELPLFQKNMKVISQKKLLTSREYEILEFIVSGDNYKNIAEKLFISQNTFKTHVKSIFHKLKLNGRTEIVYQFNCSDITHHINQSANNFD